MPYTGCSVLHGVNPNEKKSKILNALNKAHWHNDKLIRVIKLCSKSVVKPLSMIYKDCSDTGTFQDIWKRSNIIPVQKKVDNYSPVSFLSIFGKNFEKLLFNSMMDFLEENNLLNSN